MLAPSSREAVFIPRPSDKTVNMAIFTDMQMFCELTGYTTLNTNMTVHRVAGKLPSFVQKRFPTRLSRSGAERSSSCSPGTRTLSRDLLRPGRKCRKSLRRRRSCTWKPVAGSMTFFWQTSVCGKQFIGFLRS
ncbi:hypothetical protein DPMN_089665 [Dreissena polymorpha]|uniref:Uncharacterized protein n=1 Tax=Dreissena polymorpha TaxID=45954 RepID=A0A9D4KWV3_DREPO|nr:hypothetical protein DPMN_089665 [Dreissena polymorpha]